MSDLKSLPSEIKFQIIDFLVEDDPKIIKSLLQTDRNFHDHTIASTLVRERLAKADERVTKLSRSLFEAEYKTADGILFHSDRFVEAFAPLYKFQEKDSKNNFINEAINNASSSVGNNGWRVSVSHYYSDIHKSEKAGEIPSGSLSTIIGDSIEALQSARPDTEDFKSLSEVLKRGRQYFNKDHRSALQLALNTEEARKNYEGAADRIQSPTSSLAEGSFIKHGYKLLREPLVPSKQMPELEALAKNLRAFSDQLENARQISADRGKPAANDKPSNPTRRLEALDLEIGLGSPRLGPRSPSSTEFSSSDNSPTSSGHNSPVRESISNDEKMDRLAENFKNLTLKETPFLDLKEPGKWLKSSVPRITRPPREPLQQRLDKLIANSAPYQEEEPNIPPSWTEKSPTLAAKSTQSASGQVLSETAPRGLENHDRGVRDRGGGYSA